MLPPLRSETCEAYASGITALVLLDDVQIQGCRPLFFFFLLEFRPYCNQPVARRCSQVSCGQSPITKEMSCHTLIADLYTKWEANFKLFFKSEVSLVVKVTTLGQNNLISGKINTRLFRCCCARRATSGVKLRGCTVPAVYMPQSGTFYQPLGQLRWHHVHIHWLPAQMDTREVWNGPKCKPRPLCFGSQ